MFHYSWLDDGEDKLSDFLKEKRLLVALGLILVVDAVFKMVVYHLHQVSASHLAMVSSPFIMTTVTTVLMFAVALYVAWKIHLKFGDGLSPDDTPLGLYVMLWFSTLVLIAPTIAFWAWDTAVMPVWMGLLLTVLLSCCSVFLLWLDWAGNFFSYDYKGSDEDEEELWFIYGCGFWLAGFMLADGFAFSAWGFPVQIPILMVVVLAVAIFLPVIINLDDVTDHKSITNLAKILLMLAGSSLAGVAIFEAYGYVVNWPLAGGVVVGCVALIMAAFVCWLYQGDIEDFLLNNNGIVQDFVANSDGSQENVAENHFTSTAALNRTTEDDDSILEAALNRMPSESQLSLLYGANNKLDGYTDESMVPSSELSVQRGDSDNRSVGTVGTESNGLISNVVCGVAGFLGIMPDYGSSRSRSSSIASYSGLE